MTVSDVRRTGPPWVTLDTITGEVRCDRCGERLETLRSRVDLGRFTRWSMTVMRDHWTCPPADAKHYPRRAWVVWRDDGHERVGELVWADTRGQALFRNSEMFDCDGDGDLRGFTVVRAPALDGVPPERVTDLHYALAGIWVECAFCLGWVIPGDVVEVAGLAAFRPGVAHQWCYEEGLPRLPAVPAPLRETEGWNE